MRCQAKVLPRALEIRSRLSAQDERCCRTGKVKVGRNRFCRQHAELYREHYKILGRILFIPPRDIG